MGLVPAESRLWDVVSLPGLDLPFVLRKIDSDTYIMIGEAYIHGTMDGKVPHTHNMFRISDCLDGEERETAFQMYVFPTFVNGSWAYGSCGPWFLRPSIGNILLLYYWSLSFRPSVL